MEVLLGIAIVLFGSLALSLKINDAASKQAQLETEENEEPKQLTAPKEVVPEEREQLTAPREVDPVVLDTDEYGTRVKVELIYKQSSFVLAGQARYPCGHGPEFEMSPNSSFARARQIVWATNVFIGHSLIDRRYIIRCDDPDVLHFMWSGIKPFVPHDELPDVRITSRREAIELTASGPRDSYKSTLPERVARVLGHLAGSDPLGVDALRAIPNSVSMVLTPDEIGVHVHAPCVVYVGLANLENPPRHTYARTESEGAELNIELTPGQVPEQTPIMARPYAAKVGAGTLIRHRNIATFRWPGIERDPDKLLAGARLVASLDAPHQDGIYR